MANEYTALHGLLAPGTSVYGYHRGDPVAAPVVESWELTVGEANDPDADVVAGDIPDGDLGEAPATRPSEADTRTTWEAWAVRQGMDADQAAAASMEELYAVGTASPAKAPRAAKKAAKPAVGDTVAVAATEASQG